MKRIIIAIIVLVCLCLTSCKTGENDASYQEESSKNIDVSTEEDVSERSEEVYGPESRGESEEEESEEYSEDVSEVSEVMPIEASEEISEDISAEESEAMEESSEEGSEEHQYIINPITTTSSNPEESDEVSDEPEESDISEPEESKPPVIVRDDVTVLEAIKSLNVVTISGKSLVCYAADKEPDGGQVILVFNNNTGNRTSEKRTYRFYSSASDYEKAKQNQPYTEFDDNCHIMCVGITTDEPVGNPDENIYVFIFGYVRY